MADDGGSHIKVAKDLIKNGVSSEKSHLSGDSSKLSSRLDLDPYDEDQAELRFLQSKPTCFVVLGKPGVGKTKFAAQLAEEWKCQFINAYQLITEAMHSQTELGKRAEEILLRGESVPEQLAVKLLEEKIHSPEVAHHGYVLDDFPCLGEEFLTIKQQLDFINTWPLTPDFILHLKIPDIDLENRRTGQKVDPVTGELYTKDVYDPDKPKKEVKVKAAGEDEEEEEEEEEEQEEDEEDDTNKLELEIVERLIKRPEDIPAHVGNNIQMYKSSMLRLLEDYMADHNQQFLFELDANKPSNVLVQDTLTRLSCFRVSPAAVPIRLNEAEAEEESVPDDTDTDDLFRSLAGKRAPSSRFRWRRSRWLRCCPVALYEGNLLPGRAELAVAFLDKIYFLSSEEALSAFLKNPRPYLLPPQPRPPCKLIVTGPSLSGKTTLCNLLAKKYGAQVLNIKDRMGPKLVVERERRRTQLIEEVTQSSILAVQTKLEEEARRKIKEEQETQQRQLEEEAKLRIEEGEEEEEQEEMEDVEKTKPVEVEISTLDDKEGRENVDEEMSVSSSVIGAPEAENEEGVRTNRSDDGEKTEEKTNEIDAPVTEKEEPGTASPSLAVPEFPPIEVSADHPDVMRAVEEALKASNLDEFQLPLDGWMDALEETIEEVEKELRTRSTTGPLHGGWILDNFPETKEQWTLLFERNVILPDCILALQDSSPNGELLIKRWYISDKDSIDGRINERLEIERFELQKQEEEKRRLMEEQKAEEARIKAEEERQRRLESGELEEGMEEEEEKEIPPEQMGESQKPKEEVEEELSPVKLPSIVLPEVSASDTEARPTEEVRDDEEETPDQVVLDQDAVEDQVEGPTEGPVESAREVPLEGPEVAARRDLMKKYDANWANIVSIITGNSALEPYSVSISAAAAASKADASEDGDASESGPAVERSENDVSAEVVKYMERIFLYQGWERTATDIDEEEGGDTAGEEDEVEEEEQEEEEESEDFDPNRSIKKPLGDTSFYCPVLLKEKGVLWPGDPECGAKYREKIYYLSDLDARDRFLTEPALYLPTDGPLVPPPLRILLLGPRGAGKTTHARHLAKKLGLFHIQFRERLQELVIAKTKKKVVPEREEEPDEVYPVDEEPEEVSPAISILDESKTAVQNKEPISIIAEGDQSTRSVRSQGPDASASNPVTPSGANISELAEQEVLDEVPLMQLTDEEESIVAYLRDDEPLPADFLLKLLEEWWHQEPFKSTGFILEGFPSTADEVNVLGEHGLFPDTAVILNIEDTDVLARLLPPKMERWRQRRNRKIAHRQQVKEKKKEKREREMRMRKEELMNEAEARRQERLAEKQKEDGEATDEDEEEPEDDNIDAKIAEEFEEEEEEEEEEETEEDATDRVKNEFLDIYETDTSKIANVMEKLAELMITRMEVDSGRRQQIVRYTLTKRLKPLVEHRLSMFERVFPITERLAQKMLLVGYKQKSRFGQWCPVKLAEGDYQQPRHDPGFSSYPAIHRAYIYFLSSQQAREEFMLDPLTFLCQPSPKPVVPIRMAIIGPPKSGKTTLASRFADDFGLARLSFGEAIRNVLANQSRTELAQCIQLYLYQGLTVPDECAVQALDVYLMDVQCQMRGYILDGYPLKKIQVNFMEERNIIPVKVIELQVDSKELANRATKDRYSPDRVLPLHDSAEIFAVKLSAWQTEIEAVREWFQKQHVNWVALPGDRSKWWMWNSAKEIARNSVVQIQTYLQRIAEGKAASIAGMCITPNEFAARLADFGQYCPVSLALKGELCDCSTETSLKYAAEFRGHYYILAGQEELDMFLNDPEKFLPPNAARRLPSPEMLPKRRTGAEARQMFPKAIELQGYCPVTFLDGKQRYEAIVPGNPELVVEYRDKLFCMETEEKLQKFMRLPEKYWNLKLPHKLPARKEPMRVNGLPMLGYLEQTVAQVVTKAMTAVGNFKPKYPFMSATQSALVYFALQLKAMNPNSTEYVRKKYKRKLLQYEETCELISYLGTNMTRRYKEPKDRPIDFDFKLDKFMQLQTTKVKPDMWVS